MENKTNNNSLEINARQMAVRILTRVEKEGAYANLLLRDSLDEIEDPRDRHLVSSLVNGVLKNKLLLDYALRRHLKSPMSSFPYELRALLRMGAFQLLFLTKIPAFAAINESVNLCKNIKQISGHNYPALVNGVLRRTAEEGWDFAWPDKNKQPWRYLSIRYSHPEWLVKRWLKRWGAEETEQLLKANNEPSATIIRVNTLKTGREELIAKLQSLNLKCTPIDRLPEAIRLEDFSGVEGLDVFKGGLFTVQDESSQLVAHILGVRPGQRVLDTCSAPGGKTTHMAQLMQNKGEIVAVDINPQKLKLVEQLAGRLGIDIIKTVESDARKLEGIDDKFDRVLVDAPCSGWGTLRRNPEILLKNPNLEDLFYQQLSLLHSASSLVKEGGVMVYCVCSITKQETREVVKEWELDKGKEWEKLDLGTGEREMIIWPHQFLSDGFFAVAWRKNGKGKTK